MTTTEMAAAIEQTRAILNDPDRVVLDPAHYVETVTERGRTYIERLDYLLAAQRRASCRVCFCGAAVIAATENLPSFTDDHGDALRAGGITDSMPVLRELTDAALELGIIGNERFGNKTSAVAVLTQALVDDRVDEVCDLALEQLKVLS